MVTIRLRRASRKARKYGFIRGAYHYFIPKTDARKQADFFIRTQIFDWQRETCLPYLMETTGEAVTAGT